MADKKLSECKGLGNAYINAPIGTEEKIAEQLQTCRCLEEPYHRVKGYDSSKPKLKRKMTENKQFEKFRKIPVVIEAYQTDEVIEIETLEGTMKADKGDWIIKGVKGELYPCKPDVFEMTYEKVD